MKKVKLSFENKHKQKNKTQISQSIVLGYLKINYVVLIH